MGKRVKDCIVHLLFHTPKPVACPLLFPLPSHCDPNCHLLWECVMASLCMSERENLGWRKKSRDRRPHSPLSLTALLAGSFGVNGNVSFMRKGGKAGGSSSLVERREEKQEGKAYSPQFPPPLLIPLSYATQLSPSNRWRGLSNGEDRLEREYGARQGGPQSLTFRGHWLGSLPVWVLGQRGLHGGAAWGSLSGTASNAGKWRAPYAVVWMICRFVISFNLYLILISLYIM